MFLLYLSVIFYLVYFIKNNKQIFYCLYHLTVLIYYCLIITHFYNHYFHLLDS